MFDVRFRVVRGGVPNRCWVEVIDDDVVLHDLIGVGPTRSDGTVRVRFRPEVFRQQPWERESLPDLVIRAWPDHDAPPDPDEPPLVFRIPEARLDGGNVDLGDLELADAAPERGWWWQRLNVSIIPGFGHTLESVTAIAADVLPVVRRACRAPDLRPVTIELADLGESVLGSYGGDRRVQLARWAMPFLSDDALRRLIAHELAHAAAHHAEPELFVSSSEDPVEVAAHFANHEGFAHYVEELAAEQAFPLAHVHLWDHALDEVDGVALEGSDGLKRALRRLGLEWYRCEGAGDPVRFRSRASRELLDPVTRLLDAAE